MWVLPVCDILRVAVRRTPFNGWAPLPKRLRRVAVLDELPCMLKSLP